MPEATRVLFTSVEERSFQAMEERFLQRNVASVLCEQWPHGLHEQLKV